MAAFVCCNYLYLFAVCFLIELHEYAMIGYVNDRLVEGVMLTVAEVIHRMSSALSLTKKQRGSKKEQQCLVGCRRYCCVAALEISGDSTPFLKSKSNNAGHPPFRGSYVDRGSRARQPTAFSYERPRFRMRDRVFV